MGDEDNGWVEEDVLLSGSQHRQFRNKRVSEWELKWKLFFPSRKRSLGGNLPKSPAEESVVLGELGMGSWSPHGKWEQIVDGDPVLHLAETNDPQHLRRSTGSWPCWAASTFRFSQRCTPCLPVRCWLVLAGKCYELLALESGLPLWKESEGSRTNRRKSHWSTSFNMQMRLKELQSVRFILSACLLPFIRAKLEAADVHRNKKTQSTN